MAKCHPLASPTRLSLVTVPTWGQDRLWSVFHVVNHTSRFKGGVVFFRAIPCPCSRQAIRTLLCSSGTTPRSRPSTQPWHPHPCFGSGSQRLVLPRDLGFEFRESGRDIRPILTCRHIFQESALPPSRPTRQQHHSCGPPPHSREHHPCATSMWRRADHLPLHHTHAWHCRQ